MLRATPGSLKGDHRLMDARKRDAEEPHHLRLRRRHPFTSVWAWMRFITVLGNRGPTMNIRCRVDPNGAERA
jgi:hypothetical protein